MTDKNQTIAEFAAERKLPVVVHSRYADADTLDMLGEFSTVWKKSFHGVEKSWRRPSKTPAATARWNSIPTAS